MSETAAQRKVVGAVWLTAAVISIAVAFVVQPFGDWGALATVMALLMAMLGATGVWMLATGRGQLFSPTWGVKARRIASTIGLVAATLLVAGYLISDWASWTAVDVLSVGVWIALDAMFIVGLLSTRTPS